MVFSDVTLERSQLEEDWWDIVCAFESGEPWASSPQLHWLPVVMVPALSYLAKS